MLNIAFLKKLKLRVPTFYDYLHRGAWDFCNVPLLG